MFRIKHILRQEAGDDGAEGGTPAATSTPVETPAETNWRDSLSSDIKDNESLAKFTEIDALAKSYINAEKMIGKDKIVIPTDEAQWNEAYAKLGRPSDPEGYEIKPMEGFDVNDDALGFFKGLFHTAGLNQSQAEKLFNGFSGHILESMKGSDDEIMSQMKQEDEVIRKEWGEAYESNVKLANRAAEEFGGEDFVKFLSDSGYQQHPQMLKFLSKIGQMNDEDNLHDGNGDPGMTPDSLKEEINSLMASDAYTNKSAIDHNDAVKKVAALFNRLHASG